jgi:hypothetical protein
MWFHRLTRLSSAVACAGTWAAIVGCGIDRSGLSAEATGGGGAAPVGSGGMIIAGGGGSKSGGSGGEAPAGTGGAPAGSGGSAPGSGGTASGTGGEDTGSGGAVTGSGGAVAGSGGATSGTGGLFVVPGTGGREAGTGGGGAGGNDVTPRSLGCADGTREAFADPARFPAIAGCAGAWSVPGLVTMESRAPACGRAAGNDAGNTAGAGCTVEDLCADGWRVCGGARELGALGVTCAEAGIPASSAGGPLFFATRQRGTPPTSCSPDEATTSNNLHGCGNFGRAEDAGCAPLNRQIEHSVCAANPPWACSESTGIMSEATVVTKSGPSGGGVLCCRQPS